MSHLLVALIFSAILSNINSEFVHNLDISVFMKLSHSLHY